MSRPRVGHRAAARVSGADEADSKAGDAAQLFEGEEPLAQELERSAADTKDGRGLLKARRAVIHQVYELVAEGLRDRVRVV